MLQRYDEYLNEYEKGVWCRYSDVEELEKQNEQLLGSLIEILKFIKEGVCDICKEDELNWCDDCVYRNGFITVESITGKK